MTDQKWLSLTRVLLKHMFLFQYWSYTEVGEIRRDDMCMDYIFHTVMMYPCCGIQNAVSQIWLYEKKVHLHSPC